MIAAFRHRLFRYRRHGERAVAGDGAETEGPDGGAPPLARSARLDETSGILHRHPVGGWIFYDAECALCVRAMRRVRRLFASREFEWVSLQTPGSAARLGVPFSAFQTRFHVLTADGHVFHNADALAVLCRSVWWLWPLGFVLSLPGFRNLGRLGYDWLARNRYCLGGHCTPIAGGQP